MELGEGVLMIDFGELYPNFSLNKNVESNKFGLKEQKSLVKFDDNFYSVQGVFVTQRAIMEQALSKCLSDSRVNKTFETKNLWLVSKPCFDENINVDFIHTIVYAGLNFSHERLFLLEDFDESVINERNLLTGIINENGVFQSVSEFGIILKPSNPHKRIKEIFKKEIKGVVLAKWEGNIDSDLYTTEEMSEV